MKKDIIFQTFRKMPTLNTERLVLRPLRTSDADDMYEYARRDDVTEYLLWSPHESVFFTRNYLAYIEKRYRTVDFYDWAITLADSGKMIGTVGFTKIDVQNQCGEIGYVLNPDYHGAGIATEAAARVIEFAFKTLGLHRVEAKFMRGNDASLRVTQKLGMTFEGYHEDAMLVKGKYRTIGYAAILHN